jgi:hypothetical protein
MALISNEVLLEVEKEHTEDWHSTTCAFFSSLSLDKSKGLITWA